jgi:hypothetical protein
VLAVLPPELLLHAVSARAAMDATSASLAYLRRKSVPGMFIDPPVIDVWWDELR